MKMKPEHYQHLKTAITALPLEKVKADLRNDPRVKDFDKRLRWDLMYAAKLSDWACETLYPYLNDDHIDTALKAIMKEIETQPNIRIYDNGGRSYDRYTCVFMDREYAPYKPALREALGFNAEPFAALGFGQYCAALPGRHLGKRIKFEDLNADCQQFIKQNL